MYTKILAQGIKFGSGTTGLDNPADWLLYSVQMYFGVQYTQISLPTL